MQSAEGRRRNIVDSDDETFDDDNPLFFWINGSPRCEIALNVTPNKNGRKKKGWEINSILASRRVQGLPEEYDTCVFGLCVHRCGQK